MPMPPRPPTASMRWPAKISPSWSSCTGLLYRAESPGLRDPAVARRGDDELVRHAAGPLAGEERHRVGHRLHRRERLARLVAREGFGLGRLDRGVDREQRRVDALGAQLLRGGLDEGARAKRAGGPGAPA